MVKPTTIKTMLTIAVSKSWKVKQLDVNNAFLNGELQEEIYMQQPPRYEKVSQQPLVCKLTKTLYGLKQASRAWFLKLKQVLQALGFSTSRADNSLFYKFGPHSCTMLLTYVDDILITGNDEQEMETIIQHLNSSFSLKDLGKIHSFLGIEITHTTNGMHLCQRKYIRDLLTKAKMTEAKGTPTPMVSSIQLSKVRGNPTVDGPIYRSIVGALQCHYNKT